MRTTQESLGIFWNGEEVDGITVYGFWNRRPAQYPSISGALGEAGLHEKRSELHGDDWCVHIWDIRIEAWPSASEWRRRVRNALRKVINAGACVAWGGLEGAFVDPPDLFKPEHMAGGVWAAMTNEGRFYCRAELAGEFNRLSDSELLHLSSRVGSCA